MAEENNSMHNLSAASNTDHSISVKRIKIIELPYMKY